MFLINDDGVCISPHFNFQKVKYVLQTREMFPFMDFLKHFTVHKLVLP